LPFRGVTMSLHKLTAWSGYDYLTRQVAALDATDKGHATICARRRELFAICRQRTGVRLRRCWSTDRHQHPHVMVETPDGKRKRSYTIRAIPYQDPQQEAERLKAVHEARVKIVPRRNQQILAKEILGTRAVMSPILHPSLRSRSVDAGDDRFGFGKVPAEWRAADRTSDIPGHRVDQPRPRSGSGHRYVLSIVVPQGDDALDTQEWDSEHPGQETDLDQHGGRRSVAEPDVAVSIPSRRR